MKAKDGLVSVASGPGVVGRRSYVEVLRSKEVVVVNGVRNGCGGGASGARVRRDPSGEFSKLSVTKDLMTVVKGHDDGEGSKEEAA